jgi:hypothetical protein
MKSQWSRYGPSPTVAADLSIGPIASELVTAFMGRPWYTGTGFPRVFYLMYHLYRQYFPLIALTTYKKVMGEKA